MGRAKQEAQEKKDAADKDGVPKSKESAPEQASPSSRKKEAPKKKPKQKSTVHLLQFMLSK